jgi:hypothetical protein
MSGEPLEELDAELKELSPMARSFLPSQGIATAKAFLSISTPSSANALMDWRKQCDSSKCTFYQAQCCINSWKAKLRKRQSSMSGVPLVELDAELKTLSLMARRFLSYKGIATAEAFLSTKAGLANALMDWRKRYHSSECRIEGAYQLISLWKEKLRKQRQLSMLEEPLVELDAELKTNTAMGRSMEDDNAGNDCFSLHQEEFKGAEPRDDSSKQKPDSKRKRPQDELCELQSNGTNQTQDAPDETTLGAATATPVSEVSVKTEQAGPLMFRFGTMRRSVAIRTFPLPAAVNETATGKTKEDANASNDCVSHHHEDAMGADPRDDSSEQKPDSKRKRLQDESSPKKCRYTVFWV